mmetsp:Transcript_81870/g.144871  ORF Transcript_81870/g.144871 Transcript_81870/m.144871 type:complete len:172 (-) Transcript_81870:24-539(-)
MPIAVDTQEIEAVVNGAINRVYVAHSTASRVGLATAKTGLVGLAASKAGLEFRVMCDLWTTERSVLQDPSVEVARCRLEEELVQLGFSNIKVTSGYIIYSQKTQWYLTVSWRFVQDYQLSAKMVWSANDVEDSITPEKSFRHQIGYDAAYDESPGLAKVCQEALCHAGQVQ